MLAADSTQITVTVAPETNTASADKSKDVQQRTFRAMPMVSFGWQRDKSISDLLSKWGLKDRLRMWQYQYLGAYAAYQAQDFLLEFFSHPEILTSFKVMNDSGDWAMLGNRVTAVEWEPVEASVLSMDFFDKLQDNQAIVRSNGDIIKCFDEYTEDNVVVSDELRKCLLMPESEQWSLFSATERSELIFHLLRSLCLGGQLCQYEDQLKPYLDVTKSMYKDLVNVVKDGVTGQLKLTSHVYRIKRIESNVASLFPIEHPQNFCYVIVDSHQHFVRVLYHAEPSYY